MSDTVSFAGLEAQRVGLLPGRIGLSLFSSSGGGRVGGNGQNAVGGAGTNVGQGINTVYISPSSVFGANGTNAPWW
mgnify:CR=1 FL=1